MTYLACVNNRYYDLIQLDDASFEKLHPPGLLGMPVYFKMDGGLPKVWPTPLESVVIYRLEEQPVLTNRGSE